MSNLFDDFMEVAGDTVEHTERTSYVKAPFGWVGGKSESVPHLIPIITDYLPARWIDVFGGSGVVSWNVPFQQVMVYNDAYSGIVDFYRCLRDQEKCNALITQLKLVTPPASREEWIRARSSWCDSTDPVDRAAKWFYMIKYSVLQKGKAFGRGIRTSLLHLPDCLKDFMPIHDILQHFLLENLDFRTIIRDFKGHDALFYVDNPYVGTDQGAYERKFSREDLRDLLNLIEQTPGTFLLSGYDDTQINERKCWAKKKTWEVHSTSAVQAFTEQNNRADKQNVQTYFHAKECLWIKES